MRVGTFAGSPYARINSPVWAWSVVRCAARGAGYTDVGSETFGRLDDQKAFPSQRGADPSAEVPGSWAVAREQQQQGRPSGRRGPAGGPRDQPVDRSEKATTLTFIGTGRYGPRTAEYPDCAMSNKWEQIAHA